MVSMEMRVFWDVAPGRNWPNVSETITAYIIRKMSKQCENFPSKCEISGSHGGEYEDESILGYSVL
jgi:hypothetical protein